MEGSSMENKKFIFKIMLCAGAGISILYVFYPIMSFLGENMSMWTVLMSGEATDIFEFITDSEALGVIAPILLFWMPAALVIISVIMAFVTNRFRSAALIIALIGAVDFLVMDVIMMVQELIYGGVFINIVGSLIIIAAAIVLYMEDSKAGAVSEMPPNDAPSGGGSQERPVCGRIICLAGEYAGGEFDISDTLVIGRDAHYANIILSNAKVSREHCVIRYIPATDTYTVKDMSSNGTYYSDGKRLVKGYEMQVPRGTEICIGEPKEIFRLD